ncbi:uncharacterized protein N7459_005523 [Penicillium hispanicum]|uniref:uncharacterized protein n=1 Tax=Penicillium hispanicum TaxID=1080232 RepID=UPI00253F8945|nr:uncharacterized protein N7459_005523 [Penicillium hispanicum]KAJ5579538.1 hypothetical protein N7459_005523 [Penicillium hispanicum]
MACDILILQMIGTLGCGVTAGGIMSLSVMNVPTLVLPARQPPPAVRAARQVPATPIPHLTHQWLDVYERGKEIFPPLATLASLANGYLAWALRDAPTSTPMGYSWTTLYVTAVVTTLSIVPWTLTVMKSTNGKLRAHATRDDAALAEGTKGMVMSEEEKAKRAREDAEIPALLQRWAWLNFGRGVFPLLGAVVGFCGVAWMR